MGIIDVGYGDDHTGRGQIILTDPVVIKDVYVGENMTDEPILTLRLREEPPDSDYGGPAYRYVLEAAIQCGCGATNWVLLGTDPGEYRCINCMDWI